MDQSAHLTSAYGNGPVVQVALVHIAVEAAGAFKPVSQVGIAKIARQVSDNSK